MSADNIAIRLKLLIRDLDITNSEFADKCGFSRATLSQLLTGRNKKISDVMISLIHDTYPDLSILWLLFDEGPMWLGDKDHSGQSESGAAAESHNDNPGQHNFANGPADDVGDIFDDPAYHTVQTEDPPPYGSDKQYRHNSDRTAGFRAENRREDSKFADNGTVSVSRDKENPLNPACHDTQVDEKLLVEAKLKIANLQNEIESIKSRIKKIDHITVYFDDQTFQSFFPAK